MIKRADRNWYRIEKSVSNASVSLRPQKKGQVGQLFEVEKLIAHNLQKCLRMFSCSKYLVG
jgi:hypothetical protein